MKIKIVILLIFAWLVYGITFTANVGELKTPESALTGQNLMTWIAKLDTVNAVLNRHKADDTAHIVADTLTVDVTGTASSLRGAINYGNDTRLALITHFATDTTGTSADSCHWHADLRTIPDALSLNASYPAFETYASALDLVFNAHCASDTTGTDSVHTSADVDTLLYTYQAHTSYSLTDYSSINVVTTSSSVSSGATFYIAISMDDINYNVLDSVVVSANGVNNTAITGLWKYIKVYCNAYTDGTHKINFLMGGK